MTIAWGQLVLLSLAFWIALAYYARLAPRPTARFVLGLGLGASLSCIGWWVLQRGATPIGLGGGLLSGGATLLFFPLGPLLLCREAAAFRSLPLALAVARTGCLAAGCCYGFGGAPTREIEIAGFVALYVLLRKLDDRHVIPVFLVVFGAIRLATDPWRASSLDADLLVPASAIAAAWVAAGTMGWLAKSREVAIDEPRDDVARCPGGSPSPLPLPCISPRIPAASLAGTPRQAHAALARGHADPLLVECRESPRRSPRATDRREASRRARARLRSQRAPPASKGSHCAG